MSIEPVAGKKNTKNNYKSKRFPTDLAMLRGTKLYTKQAYTEFERNVLDELKKKPGKKLLINEM